MRAIRKPDNYVTAKSAAAMLREIADTIEHKADSWHSVYVTIASATAEEIEAAHERARVKAAKRKGPLPVADEEVTRDACVA